MFEIDASKWAESVFNDAKLGDPRRTKRLVKLAENMAKSIGKSVVKSCQNSAEVEAAYRFMRNENVKAHDIQEAGFELTAKHANAYEELLAIEDTTSINFSHPSIKEELGHITASTQARGYQVHSVLLFAPKEHDMVGLIEQHSWSRDITTMGKRNKADTIYYPEKESYKWERASQRMVTRLSHDVQKRIISVCDREADIYDYMAYKLAQGQRFIVRSSKTRRIEEANDKLYEFGSRLVSAGERTLHIEQRGAGKKKKARQGRSVQLHVSFSKITIKCPTAKSGEALPLYYVLCRDNNDEVCWHLMTSETVETIEQAQKIVDYYEKRWLIEDYHKAWKSGGTDVEQFRMQSANNIEKLMVITAFVAVRIMQLRLCGRKMNPHKDRSCECMLSPLAWKLLWLKLEKNKKLPKKTPTADWAYQNVAILGGWTDSKRTGVAGWVTLWEGWLKLQDMIEGYHLAQELKANL